MNSDVISVTVTYREPVTFHLRMVGIDEESQLRQKMFGLSEEEKKTKSYQNNIDMLADLVIGKEEFLNTEGHFHSAQAVRNYFLEKTAMKERIAEYAVRGYFLRLQPDVIFS